MNVQQVIKVHDSLWKRPIQRGFQQTRSLTLRFVTQNMSKRSRNTDWINGDPVHRKLTWLFDSRGYKGMVREYEREGKQVIEVHTLNPDVLIYKAER